MESVLEWQQARYRNARERIHAAGEAFQRQQAVERRKAFVDALPKVANTQPVDAVTEWLNKHENPKTRAEKILAEVAEKHGVSVLDIKSARRLKKIVPARQEACYRLRYETPLSFPSIGKILGDRDHTTIMYGVEQHELRLEGKR